MFDLPAWGTSLDARGSGFGDLFFGLGRGIEAIFTLFTDYWWWGLAILALIVGLALYRWRSSEDD